MRYLGLILIHLCAWISQIPKVNADANVLAFSCVLDNELNKSTILLENDKTGVRLIAAPLVNVSSVKEIAPQVFEFKYENAGLIGYLRQVDVEWKFLLSDAGLITQYSCSNLSNELKLVAEYYASSMEKKSGDLRSLTGSASFNQIGSQEFIDDLLVKNKNLIEHNSQLKGLLEMQKEQFSALQSNTNQSLRELITASNERIVNLTSVNNSKLEDLGSRLNAALARAASEERQRRRLEKAERIRNEAEAKKLKQRSGEFWKKSTDLANYKLEFFSRLREILVGQQGVKIVGDRFIFSSDLLFSSGAASLSEKGQLEIDKVTNILLGIEDSIPNGIEWVIRVDGHTDNVPLSGVGEFRDNWELSQARALSVVRYMVETLGFPASRIGANGFGEFQPVNPDDTPQARAQNRRVEIKLTQR